MRTARSCTYWLERTSRGRETETGPTLGSQEQRRIGEHLPAPAISGRVRETTADWPGRALCCQSVYRNQDLSRTRGWSREGNKRAWHDSEWAEIEERGSMTMGQLSAPSTKWITAAGMHWGTTLRVGLAILLQIPPSSPDFPASHPQRFSYLCSLWLQASQESRGKYT